jgi:hypothetical protein
MAATVGAFLGFAYTAYKTVMGMDIIKQPLALRAIHYDLMELLIDAEYAKRYLEEVEALVDKSEVVKGCSVHRDNLIEAVERLNALLEQLRGNGGIRKALLKDASKASTIQFAADALKQTSASLPKMQISNLVNTTFTFMDPRWYRQELAFSVNQINIIVDQLLIYFAMPVKSCPKPPELASVRQEVQRAIEKGMRQQQRQQPRQQRQQTTLSQLKQKPKPSRRPDPRLKGNPYSLLMTLSDSA